MNPRDVLHYGQREIDPIIDRYRPEDWARIALGVWTAKDLLGHLGAFEVRFLEVVQLFLGEEPATRLRETSPATFNDDMAAIRRDWPVDRVVAELRDAHRAVMECVDRIPAETWRQVGTIPWYGPEYALDDLAVYSQYGHKREHAPQLGAVLESREG
jgi:DinB family protein